MADSGIKHIHVGTELAESVWEAEATHEIVHGNSYPSPAVERQLYYRDDLHQWHICITAGSPGTWAALVMEEFKTEASSATPTPTGGSLQNYYTLTALATDAEFQEPSGTPALGNRLIIRIKDDGTHRHLTWDVAGSHYRSVAATLPTVTTASKVMYLGFIYHYIDDKWDCLALAVEP